MLEEKKKQSEYVRMIIEDSKNGVCRIDCFCMATIDMYTYRVAPKSPADVFLFGCNLFV